MEDVLTGPIRLAIVGYGTIAKAQHEPALAADPRFELVAVADKQNRHPTLPSFDSIGALLASGIALDAVSICTPPSVRVEVATEAIDAGLHILLEKPPAATVSSAERLAARAERAGVTLFATWHSREAPSVDAAREWLASREVRSVDIEWREDIRKWHPGQDWLLAAGGFGAFDPGINALSIATAILPRELRLTSSVFHVPTNRAAPTMAEIGLMHGDAAVRAVFDVLQSGPQTWDITVETDGGTLRLKEGGTRLLIDGEERPAEPEAEYPRLYARFGKLIDERKSDVDVRPLVLVADAFMVARVEPTAPFDF